MIHGWFAALGSDVPVTPDADQARGWLERELLRAPYHQSPSILDRILRWIGEQFDGMPVLGMPPATLAIVVTVIVLLVVALVLWVAGPVRRARRVGTDRAVHADDDRRTAAQLRADADAAAARGEWATAVADRFRGIVRDLEERAVLDERPGRTAHEAVEAACRPLPALAGDLRRAGRLFDDVVYGDVPATAADDALLRTLDRAVAVARATAVAGAGVGPDGGVAR